jgi:PadR family transcriptional regulator, regulatory protein PadR
MRPDSPANEPTRVTVPMIRVLDLLLSEPHRDDWFALHIVRATKLGSGTVVQILFRLERWGWVESRWEDLAVASDQRRPRRKFYHLTGTGTRKARDLLQTTLPRSLRLRPA